MNGTIHETREGEHVVVVEIDNPPRNSLGSAMRKLLRGILARLAADHSVRAIVLAGRGNAFCSGDDLREEFEAVAGGGERGANLVEFGHLLDEVEAFRAPVIAAVGGWCVGGGFELALCSDIRLASTEAKFVCAGVNVGLMASAYRLPRLIGASSAKHMLFTGLAYDAGTALRFGLVTDVFAPADLMPRAIELASRIASRAPLSVEASKRIAGQAANLAPAEALALQGQELSALLHSADHLAALTAFLEKRTPTFTRS